MTRAGGFGSRHCRVEQYPARRFRRLTLVRGEVVVGQREQAWLLVGEHGAHGASPVFCAGPVGCKAVTPDERLNVEVGEVGPLPCCEEAVADVADGALDAAFLVATGGRTRRVQSSFAGRALERRARNLNLLTTLKLGAGAVAVSLPAIAVAAHECLPPARRPRAHEHPKLDHGAGPRRFLDKRREPSDAALADRATTRRMKARRISPGSRYLGGLVADLSSPGRNPAPLPGSRARYAPESRGSGEPPTSC
jgi:hypothetical protein